jgi:hypothetical protein
MASRNAQTWAKRARELAVKERRDRKRAKKAEAAAARAAGEEAPSGAVDGEGDSVALPAPEPASRAQT